MLVDTLDSWSRLLSPEDATDPPGSWCAFARRRWGRATQYLGAERKLDSRRLGGGHWWARLVEVVGIGQLGPDVLATLMALEQIEPVKGAIAMVPGAGKGGFLVTELVAPGGISG